MTDSDPPGPKGTVTHAIKCWPDEFQAVVHGTKRFEWRHNDRDYQIGDLLRLLEWDPLFAGYTGSWSMVQVTYVLRGPLFEVPAGYCVMSISPLLVSWREDHRLMKHD